MIAQHARVRYEHELLDRRRLAEDGRPERADYTPLTLQPGQTGTMTLTITPSGRSGKVVRGTLYVDVFNARAGHRRRGRRGALRVLDQVTPRRARAERERPELRLVTWLKNR